MSIRKFGTGEITGPDETHQSAEQQREAVSRRVEDEHIDVEDDNAQTDEDE